MGHQKPIKQIELTDGPEDATIPRNVAVTVPRRLIGFMRRIAGLKEGSYVLVVTIRNQDAWCECYPRVESEK
jgi:hypothetical protein